MIDDLAPTDSRSRELTIGMLDAAAQSLHQIMPAFPVELRSMEFTRHDRMLLLRAAAPDYARTASVVKYLGVPIEVNDALPEGMGVMLGAGRKFLGLIDLRPAVQIMLNGQRITTRCSTLNYGDVLALAKLQGTPTCVVHYPASSAHRDRHLVLGENCAVVEGMRIEIVHTGNA